MNCCGCVTGMLQLLPYLSFTASLLLPTYFFLFPSFYSSSIPSSPFVFLPSPLYSILPLLLSVFVCSSLCSIFHSFFPVCLLPFIPLFYLLFLLCCLSSSVHPSILSFHFFFSPSIPPFRLTIPSSPSPPSTPPSVVVRLMTKHNQECQTSKVVWHFV